MVYMIEFNSYNSSTHSSRKHVEPPVKRASRSKSRSPTRPERKGSRSRSRSPAAEPAADSWHVYKQELVRRTQEALAKGDFDTVEMYTKWLKDAPAQRDNTGWTLKTYRESFDYISQLMAETEASKKPEAVFSDNGMSRTDLWRDYCAFRGWTLAYGDACCGESYPVTTEFVLSPMKPAAKLVGEATAETAEQ